MTPLQLGYEETFLIMTQIQMFKKKEKTEKFDDIQYLNILLHRK